MCFLPALRSVGNSEVYPLTGFGPCNNENDDSEIKLSGLESVSVMEHHDSIG